MTTKEIVDMLDKRIKDAVILADISRRRNSFSFAEKKMIEATTLTQVKFLIETNSQTF